MQQALAFLQYSINVDGKFGDMTENAIKDFQRSRGLVCDGVAGNQTLTILFELAPQFAAAMPETASAPAPAAAVSVGEIPRGKFRLGDEMGTVRTIQQRLNALGYVCGNADAVYGKSTEKAIYAFQQQNGLSADGVAGEATLVRLFSADAKTYVPEIVPQTEAPIQAIQAPVPAAEGGTAYIRTANKKSLYVRSDNGRGQGGKVIGSLKHGTPVQVIRYGDQWTTILHNGTPAFVMTRFLQREAATDVPVSQPLQETAPVLGTVFVNTNNGQSLYLRSSARSTNNKNVVASLKNGTKLSLLENKGAWCKVTDGNQSGFVMSKFILFEAQTPSQSPSTAAPVTEGEPTKEDPGVIITQAVQPPANLLTLRIDSKDQADRAVSAMQSRLKDLGYAVKVNGVFDTLTHQAVVDFQLSNGLEASGVAYPEMQQKLYGADAKSNTASAAAPTGSQVQVSAGEVKLLHWFNEIKPSCRTGQQLTVYHPASGNSFTLRIYSMGHHADCEPLTLQDTQRMNNGFGPPSWNIQVVYVKLPSGVWTLASMHNRPHLSGAIKDNGFGGHLCVHFFRDMEETQKNDPNYGVSNQKAIRNAWKNMTGETIDR